MAQVRAAASGIGLALVTGTLLLGTACFPVHTPIHTTRFDGTRHDTVVVLLPGFAAHDTTFAKKGVVDALRRGGVEADLVAVDATFGYYTKDALIERLREDVWPLTRSYDHVWVLGISMGGLGTLLTARAFADDVEGIVLLSPYLGRGKTLRDVQDGPLRAYTPPTDPTWDEALWGYYTRLDGHADSLPVVLLGHGDKDLGTGNLDWLAGYLPADHVRVVPGGHTWTTWTTLAEGFGRDVLPRYDAFGPPAPVAAEVPPTEETP